MALSRVVPIGEVIGVVTPADEHIVQMSYVLYQRPTQYTHAPLFLLKQDRQGETKKYI